MTNSEQAFQEWLAATQYQTSNPETAFTAAWNARDVERTASAREAAWEKHIAEVAPYSDVSFPDPEAEKRGRMYKLGFEAGWDEATK